MKNNLIATLILLVLLFAGALWFNKSKMNNTPIEQDNNEVQTNDIEDLEEQEMDNNSAVATYNNDNFGLSFSYPDSWFGPEDYENEDSLRVEIGTDQVYPYGTGPEERTQTIPNSYFVVVQLNRGATSEELEMLKKLKAGEVSSDQRNMLIKVRDINENGFTGVEYISTLSETAQTQFYYTRSAVVENENGQIVTINGNSENVRITDESKRFETYEEEDEKNVQHFRMILDTLKF
jgi:hypothetical protein